MAPLERQIGGWGTPHLKDAEALGILEGHVKAWQTYIRETKRGPSGLTRRQIQIHSRKNSAKKYRAGIVPPFAKT